jgi:cytochrome c oxidase cbb3-type subunit III
VAYDVSQGKRLYRWYNCNGCHASGGGSYGPALMDGQWRYGASGAAIVQTILHGRPGGMPAFAGRIPEAQAWQIAAYVRSMSGQLRTDVAPSRADALSTGSPESQRDRLPPALDPAAATAPALAASPAEPVHAASAASEG